METNELERRFERAFADEPPLRAVPDHLHRGQRAMVRRRVLTGGAGVLAAVIVASTALVATGVLDRDQPQPARGDAALIENCRKSSETKKDADLLFSSGSPTLLTKVTGRETTALLMSADKKYWGECHVGNAAREDGSGITAYEMNPADNGNRTGGFSISGGWTGCSDPQKQCHLTFSVLERRPSEVARAEYTLANGEVLKVPTVQGFIAVEYHEPATRVPGKRPVQRAALYSADGTMLAEMVEPGITPTPGVRRLTWYPNLTGTPVGPGVEERSRELEELAPEEDVAPEKEIAKPRPGLTGRARLQDSCTLDGMPMDGPLANDPDPQVVAWHETPTTAVAVLKASKGKAWGSCYLPTSKVPYNHPYVGSFVRGDQPYVIDAGPTHNERPKGTRDFYWQLADKLDPRVSRVEVTMVDGQEISADTVDGYVALGTSGLLPADAAWDQDGWTHVNLHRSLRFYDDGGTLLGETRNELPIKGFPSLR